MSEVQFPIKLAAKKSGLTSHVIRIWEKRYNAVAPDRTGTNRRLYSEEAVNRLRLLHAAVQAGHRIGTIAQLSDAQLRDLLPGPTRPEPVAALTAWAGDDAVDSGIAAVRALDEPSLESILEQALLNFGGHGMLAKLIAPLAEKIGLLWQNGELTAAHEHFASASIRTFLLKRLRPSANGDNPARLVAVTPTGQLHELGAVIVAAAANDVGWNSLYLGANLPAAEIASAARQHRATVVALSIIYPPDDPLLPAELTALRHLLPASTKILVGGRAAEAFSATLEAIRAETVGSLSQLYRTLETWRLKPDASKSG